MVDRTKNAGATAGNPDAEPAPVRPTFTRDAPYQATRLSPRGGLSDLTRDRLAAQLREMYDSVAQQPVPDRFAELIAKLDDGDGRKA